MNSIYDENIVNINRLINKQIFEDKHDVYVLLNSLIEHIPLVILAWSGCPASAQVIGLLTQKFNLTDSNSVIWYFNESSAMPWVKEYLKDRIRASTVPQVFSNNRHIGNRDVIVRSYNENILLSLLPNTSV